MGIVKFDFDPFEGFELTKGQKSDLTEDISAFVKESVLDAVGSGRTPVAGGAFKKNLSPVYAKKTGKKISNLELTGDLLDSLEVKVVKGHKMRLTVSESEQDQADGHNNFSGKSNLPERQFIPNADRGQDFKKDIKKGIKEIIEDYLNNQ